jgi:uncharacterized protein (TIGR02466 family)
METLSLWATPVARINVADQFDMQAWADEVFTMYSMTNGEDDRQRFVDPELFPIILEMRDQIITPAVNAFCKEHFGQDMEKYYVETNGKWIVEGEGLYAHLHPGSVLSAICYPNDSTNGLNMFDPRLNAMRGYPKRMRNHHFANFRISPKQGDVWIFPSYAQHSVSHVTEEVRLSLLHEYYMIDNL